MFLSVIQEGLKKDKKSKKSKKRKKSTNLISYFFCLFLNLPV